MSSAFNLGAFLVKANVMADETERLAENEIIGQLKYVQAFFSLDALNMHLVLSVPLF